MSLCCHIGTGCCCDPCGILSYVEVVSIIRSVCQELESASGQDDDAHVPLRMFMYVVVYQEQ